LDAAAEERAISRMTTKVQVLALSWTFVIESARVLQIATIRSVESGRRSRHRGNPLVSPAASADASIKLHRRLANLTAVSRAEGRLETRASWTHAGSSYHRHAMVSRDCFFFCFLLL
jgi:hypothetical protein